MTTYSGTLEVTAAGTDTQHDTFGITLDLALVSNMSLLAGGVVAETTDVSGTISGTIRYAGGHVTSYATTLSYTNLTATTNLSDLTVLTGATSVLGVTVSFQNSLNANRSAIGVSGSAIFHVPEQVYRYGRPTSTTISGSLSVVGSLIAAYPDFAVSPLNLTALRGAPGSVTPYVFDVTRAANAAGATSTTWTVAGSGGNPATAADFAGGVLPGGIVSFAPGQTEALVTFDVVGARHAVADEGFTVQVSPVAQDSLIIPAGNLTLAGVIGANPACFAAGTRLATVAGDVPVERLAPGTAMRLAGGGTRRVAWLGRQRIDCARHPRPQEVWPFRVAAHAFGAGRPARAVFLSPDHAVFIDDVLIPIRHLANGRTVRQVPRDAIEYWHVELDRHDVLLAEGLPCESYLDLGNRDAFEGGGTTVRLPPDVAARFWDALACAPLVFGGPPLALAQRRARVQADLLALG